ncbi:MAG: MBL fold metallo-hydrolase [Cyclobacteriaceae bacterium]
MKFILLLFPVLLLSCATSPPKVKVEYIAHASFKISYEDKSLLIDPYADTTWIGYYFPKNIIADAALITHPHYDHDGGRFRGIKPYWEDQLQIIEEVGSYQVGDFKITGLKGKHCDPYGKEFDQKNTIWVIEVAEMKFVHIGDNGPLTQEHYDAIGTPDLFFVPIDGDHHILKPDELEVVLKTLNPTVTIPMHYRLPDLEDEGLPRGGLGPIDPYLVGKSVEKLAGNTKLFSTEMLIDSKPIIVFEHSKDVVRK